MNQPLALIAIVCLLFAGCDLEIGRAKNNKALPATVGVDKIVEPGIHDTSVVSKSGDIVRYTISIPEDFQPDRPTPLIMALHFGGRVTPHYARGVVEALVLPGLGELNAIIVAPDSIAGPWTEDKNETMVLELMDHIAQQYSIDLGKTVLTGFSMGGHGTWYIGSRHQERFAALIPVAGSPRDDNDIKWTTPVFALHSRADDVVPIAPTESYIAAQKSVGVEGIVLVAVDDLPHFQTGRFSEPLKDAVPWVRQIWNSGPNKRK